MIKGRLYGSRCYFAGPIDRVADSGVGWRRMLTPIFANLGIVVLDPCDKPIDLGLENIECKVKRNELRTGGQFDILSKEIKLLRVVDLRMTDISDFIVLHIDTDIHMCGSYEEESWANRLKRPILVHCAQGKKGVPDWLFGSIPHQMFFSDWNELIQYVKYIHTSEETPDHFKRWMFFNYERMTPEGQYQYLCQQQIL